MQDAGNRGSVTPYIVIGIDGVTIARFLEKQKCVKLLKDLIEYICVR
mgnify:CR=1 FL=1